MTGCVSTIQRRNPWIIFVKVVCKKLVHCRGLSTWLWLGEQITKCLPRLRFPRFVPPTFVETIASKEISCQENNIYIYASILSILFKEFVRKKVTLNNKFSMMLTYEMMCTHRNILHRECFWKLPSWPTICILTREIGFWGVGPLERDALTSAISRLILFNFCICVQTTNLLFQFV